MTTPNEREIAQLERTDETTGTEIALAVVEVAQRDEQGRIRQYRIRGEATDEHMAALGWVRATTAGEQAP